MSEVVIVSAGIAGGHDGAAHELGRRVLARGLSYQVVDLLDVLPAGTGRGIRDLYRAQLTTVPGTWDWVYRGFDRPGRSRIAGLVVRRAARALAAVIPPDARVVVSTYPLAGQAIGSLRASGRLAVPALAYLTDMAVHRLWVAPGVDAHLAIHPVPAASAVALGARSVRTVRPAVRSGFGAVPPAERPATRRSFGLPLDRPLALVVGGSWGVGEIADTMVDVAATGLAVPVALCGANPLLRRRIEAAGIGPALGWVDEMPRLLAACDVVVQNAGGLTSLEALAAGVPVISHRPLPGHGLANSRALHQAGLVPLTEDRAGLAAALVAARTWRVPELTGPDPAEVICAAAADRTSS